MHPLLTTIDTTAKSSDGQQHTPALNQQDAAAMPRIITRDQWTVHENNSSTVTDVNVSNTRNEPPPVINTTMTDVSYRENQSCTNEECTTSSSSTAPIKKLPAPKELLNKDSRNKVGIEIVLAVLGAIERTDGGWEASMESGKRGKFLEGVNDALHHPLGQLNK
jgi:hypothetical protein